MKRDIKFRGKRADNGEWVYGDLIQLDTQICIAGLHQWATVLQNNSLELGVDEVIPETIGQFTGLKDKNGKEIYEGDVIAHKLFPDDVEIVKYKDGAFRVGKFLLSTFHCSIIKRVGNIHDNPELITNLE